VSKPRAHAASHTSHSLEKTSRPVFLIDGARTPFLKARGEPGLFSATELALGASKPLMLRQPFEAGELDEVIYGCVMPGADEANIARIIALRIGGGDKLTAYTVQRNCASGLQAVDNAVRNIAHGYADLVLAGGVFAWFAAGPRPWPQLPPRRSWPKMGWGLAVAGAVLVGIANGYAEAGEFGRALDLANSIEDEFKGWSLIDIAAAYAKAGQFDRALDVASNIE